VRVVPNKFPALGIEGNLNKQAEGMFDKMNGIGAHEVVIETPDHNATWPRCRRKKSKTFYGPSAIAFSISRKTGASNTFCFSRTTEKQPAPRSSTRTRS
jgi:hypothetical protein